MPKYFKKPAGNGAGAADFLALTDTPASYQWYNGWFLRVNAAEDGLELVELAPLLPKDTALLGFHAGADSYGFGETKFIGPHCLSDNHYEVDIIVPRGGTIKNLYVHCESNSLDAYVNIYVYKNGVETYLGGFMDVAATTMHDTENADYVDAGDRITIRITGAASSGAIANLRASLEIEYT